MESNKTEGLVFLWIVVVMAIATARVSIPDWATIVAYLESMNPAKKLAGGLATGFFIIVVIIATIQGKRAKARDLRGEETFKKEK